MNAKGHAAIVTGGASGLGAATAALSPPAQVTILAVNRTEGPCVAK
jgi:NAD(P)-dependent dehydrogenase (short-subunit alcohol dehydrogenase family)